LTLRVNGFLIGDSQAEADRLQPLLDEHVRLTRAEPGCLSFEVTRVEDDPARFRLREAFRDRPAFEAHQVRTRASRWFAESQSLRRDFKITGD
jgi:quinol monooxygenase YgiN